MSHLKIAHFNGLGNTLGASINFLYFNARSIRNKFQEIENFINCSSRIFHVIVITETWLHKEEVKYYDLPNYQSFHSTRDDENITRGGGVSIYILSTFDKANEIGNKYWRGNNCLVVELLKEKKKVLGFYRQPNNRNDPDGSVFVDDLNVLLGSFSDSYVFGDFNFNLFDSSSIIERYKDAVTLNDYAILNSRSSEFPTRINYTNGTFSSIDHIFTDQTENDDILRATLSYFDLVADHKALCLSVWKSIQTTEQPNIFSYSIINHKKIRDEKLFEQLNSSDLNNLAMDIKNIIDTNTIKITRTKKVKKPYISKEIVKYIVIKKNYEKLKRLHPLSVYVNEKWKFYRNRVSNLCAKAKKKYLDQYFEKNANDSRKVWQQINAILNKKPKKNDDNSVQMIIENNAPISDKKLIANALNNHFTNISKTINPAIRISRKNVLEYHRREVVSIHHEFECPQCTEDEIKLIICELKNTNSKDVFGMSNNFLKIHCVALTPIITKLINKHMLEGNFPEALKFSVIRPLYKCKGSKTDKNSYRPVSLICILSKIFEKVIYRRLLEHIHSNDYFHIDQFGYQEKSSPEAAMLHTLHDIYGSINKRFLTALLTIDLSSAFDCIDHEVLLIKLSKLKLAPFFMVLLKEFLSNRSQSVKIGDILSERFLVFCGSPQGGVLSGLLFNIYVNSIFKLALRGKLRLYCDDMSLIASGSDKNELRSNLQCDLVLIDNWLEYHYLKANYSKTKYVLFSGRKKFESFTERSLDIKIGDTMIERVEVVKIVGLYIDELLNFSFHIGHVKNKISPFIAKLSKIRRFISEKTALTLYFSHVYSHLIFMISIYSVAPRYLTDSLGVIQRRALRTVYLKDRLCSNKELFSEKVLPFSSVCEFHQNLVMFKILHKSFKNHINLQLIREIHSYPTRSSVRNDLNVNYDLHDNDFYFRATRSFNHLSEDIRKFNSINIFKKRLKEYLYDFYIESA
jgi:hypothetical protein